MGRNKSNNPKVSFFKFRNGIILIRLHIPVSVPLMFGLWLVAKKILNVASKSKYSLFKKATLYPEMSYSPGDRRLPLCFSDSSNC